MPDAADAAARAEPAALDGRVPLRALEREAAAALEAAIAQRSAVRAPFHRDRYRALLDGAIERARLARAADPAGSPRALSLLARAHAARAEDSLHGSIQLAAASQRAPTPEACDDGWGRVAAIVEEAARSAREADVAASALEAALPGTSVARTARRAADRAQAAERAARGNLEARNDAFTFHTDYGFSFGEGWYLAAAAVLGGVTIQIEPGQPATAQAEHFLRQAGLSAQLAPCRPRPRANKSTTAIVARAFRADPLAAQQRLRQAFLGETPIGEAVRAYVHPRLAAHAGRRKVLLWVRDGVHHAGRNSRHDELCALSERIQRAGLLPILVGDALREGAPPEGAVDLLLWWKDAVFRQLDARRAQLGFFEHLRAAHGLLGQVGVTTAGMDGPALLGLPTLYLTQQPNPRMGEWVGAVPGYREVVREPGYLDVIGDALAAWARGDEPPLRARRP